MMLFNEFMLRNLFTLQESLKFFEPIFSIAVKMSIKRNSKNLLNLLVSFPCHL